MMDRQAERIRLEKSGEKPEAQSAPEAANCRELLEIMPLAFNPAAAEGLKAVYQFEVGGDENFVVHLIVADQQCTLHEGPASKPDVIIKTPPRSGSGSPEANWRAPRPSCPASIRSKATSAC